MISRFSLKAQKQGFVLFVLFVLMRVTSFSQNSAYSLIVVHLDPGGQSEFRQVIYSYHFLNGHFTGREELMSVKGRVNNKDYIRCDLGTNQIYKNRYLITGIGNIIDLKERKVLMDQRANLVRLSNDSAIYYTNDAFKGKFYSIYNFTTNKYSEVKSLTFKALAGQDVEFDKASAPFKLNLYPVNKPKVLITSDAGYGQNIPGEPRRPDPAIWWLDNSNLIYPQFNKENTEVTFVKVNVDTKSAAVLGKSPIKPQNDPGNFMKLNNTEAVFNFGEKKFSVDASKNAVTELLFTKPENGFSVECKNNAYGHIVKLNDKDIGKHHFQLKNIKTEKDIAAIVKELIVGTESYQQGLAVWNSDKQKWENVDAEDVIALIGWIKDK